MFDSIRQNIRKIVFKLRTLLVPGEFLGPVVDFFGRGEHNRGNALLIYRTLPFYLPKGHPVFNFHQNLIQSRLIAEVLNEMGYRVDVWDCSIPFIQSDVKYSLVISQSGNEDPLSPQFSDSCRIYLAAGTENLTHNLRQDQRFQAFRKRRGDHDVELQIEPLEMRWANQADAIFCFGNEAVAETWRTRYRCPVFAFQNTAFDHLREAPRKSPDQRNHFLFLGSRRQLAKGLDLLIEAFAECPDLHLHVCGHYLKDPGFCKAYETLLFHSSNIHSHGWVDIASRRFQSIAARCAFTISATCSEGSPGSITNAMKLGLIPILAAEAGIDDGNGVIILNDLTIPGIQEMIQQCSLKPLNELNELSSHAVKRAVTEFTEAAFIQRWHHMLSQTLENRRRSVPNPQTD